MVITGSSVESQATKAYLTGTWSQAVLLLLVAVAAYFQTWIDIWPYWENKNATYTHGSLVALVTLGLIWRARPGVNLVEPKPSMRALLVTLFLSGCWLLAERANVFIVYAMLWPLLAFAVIWTGLGLRAAAGFAFPLSFLYFAIPIWDYLKPPLQAVTSAMVGFLTKNLGIPAALDGPNVTLPTGTIYIAQDCSGAHFLCVALAVGVLAGVLRGDIPRVRILIIVIAGFLSMAFNWLRVLLIILAFLHPSLKHGFETIGHITFGWWVFALDLVVFSLVLRFVPRSDNEKTETQPRAQVAYRRRNNSGGLSIAIAVAIIFPAIAWALPRFDTYSTNTFNADSGPSIAKTNSISPDLRWTPFYPGAAWEGRFSIVTDGGITLEIYANRYFEQTQGRELISHVSYLFDPLDFSPKKSTVVQLRHSIGIPLPTHIDILTDSIGRSWLALYTYVVDGDPIASGSQVQLTTALRSFYGRTTAGVIAVATPCAAECEPAIPVVEDTFRQVVEWYQREIVE